MATYAVADVHGVLGPLQRLETELAWQPGSDRVFMLGDLVGRGPDSLGTLEWAYERSGWVDTLLGNHDFALLMAHAGLRKTEDRSLLRVLESSRADVLCDWLRHRPLLIEEKSYVLVHAGILPAWTLERAAVHARAMEDALCSVGYRQALADLWGNGQICDDPAAAPQDQLQLAANSFARMRMCDEAGCISLQYSGMPDAKGNGFVPWYEYPLRKPIAKPIICGHWSGHGVLVSKEVIMLDAGTVYGGPLCAWDLDRKRLIAMPNQTTDIA